MSGIIKANERNVRAYWKGVNIYNVKVFNAHEQVKYIEAGMIAIEQAAMAEKLRNEPESDALHDLLKATDAKVDQIIEEEAADALPATYTSTGVVPIENQELKIA